MSAPPARRTVAVLGGGRSPEHGVSVRSASQVATHLDPERWDVVPVYLAPGGLWHHAPDSAPGAYRGRGEKGDSAGGDPAMPFSPSLGPGLRPGRALDALLDQGIEVFWPVLHGPFGEDGTVQGMFELHDVAFVGSGCAASAVAMDKIRTRECFLAHGLPMAPGRVGGRRLGRLDPTEEALWIAGEVGLPCFLKVDLSGSTLGVARVATAEEAIAFLSAESARGGRYLAEAEVRGEEISVGVLGNAGAPLHALPPVGIYPVGGGFFTHEAKYQQGRTEEIIPPRGLDAVMVRTVQDLARRCHEALGCDGVSRTDMIVTPEGPVILETNTLPGMTRESLLPQTALADGMAFPALLDHLLELALRRHAVTAEVRP